MTSLINEMKNLNYLMLSGFCMVAAGVSMLLSESLGVQVAKILVPLAFFVGGIFAYMFATRNRTHKVAYQYHLLQGVGMMVFAMLIFIFARDLGGFLKYVSYFIGAFGLIEILFGFMATSTGQSLSMKVLFSRLTAGFFNLVGSVVLLLVTLSNEYAGLMIAGVLVVLGGTAFILFANRIAKSSKT